MSAALPVPVGEIVDGKYRVEKVLGAGGMGCVVAARHAMLDTLVAIKFMLRRGSDEEAIVRFLREAKTAARFTGPHIARVADFGVIGGTTPYMVMEHLDGRDLGALVVDGGPLAPQTAVEYVLHVCDGLAEAHAAGVVHRDIKPSNLFLTKDGSGDPCVKILDFGIAKVSGEGLTQGNRGMGSGGYMAPEQMRDVRDADARADVWGLGVTLFELLSGRRPFEAASLEQYVLRVVHGDMLSLANVAPSVPEGLVRVVEKCLRGDRAQRWPTVAHLALALLPFAPERAHVVPSRVARRLGLRTEDFVTPASAPPTGEMSPVVLPPSPAAPPPEPPSKSAGPPRAVAASHPDRPEPAPWTHSTQRAETPATGAAPRRLLPIAAVIFVGLALAAGIGLATRTPGGGASGAASTSSSWPAEASGSSQPGGSSAVEPPPAAKPPALAEASASGPAATASATAASAPATATAPPSSATTRSTAGAKTAAPSLPAAPAAKQRSLDDRL